MSGQPRSFGFVVFQHEESVNFAYKLLNGVQLYGSKIRLQPHFMTKGVIVDRGQQDRPGVNRSDSALAPPSPSPAPLRRKMEGNMVSYMGSLVYDWLLSAGDKKLAEKFKKKAKPEPLPPNSPRLADIVKHYKETTPQKRKAEPAVNGNAKKAKKDESSSDDDSSEDEAPAAKAAPAPAKKEAPAKMEVDESSDEDSSDEEEEEAKPAAKAPVAAKPAAAKKESSSEEDSSDEEEETKPAAKPAPAKAAAKKEESSSDDDSSDEEEEAKPAAKAPAAAKPAAAKKEESSSDEDDSSDEDEAPAKPAAKKAAAAPAKKEESSDDDDDDSSDDEEEEKPAAKAAPAKAAAKKEEDDDDSSSEEDSSDDDDEDEKPVKKTAPVEEDGGMKIKSNKGKTVDGMYTRTKADQSFGDKSMSEEGRKIFIHNVGEEFTYETFQEQVEKYGEVTDFFNPGRGFAFITFSTNDEAQACIKGMDNTEVGGNTIRMNIARPKGEKPAPGTGGKRQQAADGCKLFVHGVTQEINNADLQAAFEAHGTVTDAYNPGKGFAFVTFSKASEATAAMEALDNREVCGVFVNVSVAKPKGGESTPRGGGRGGRGGGGGGGGRRQEVEGAKLFVHNVSEETPTDDLYEAFGKHGTVTDAYNPGRGFAFITFATAAEANKAIEAMEGQEVCGRTIQCNVAKPRESGGGGGGHGRTGGVRQDHPVQCGKAQGEWWWRWRPWRPWRCAAGPSSAMWQSPGRVVVA